MDYNLKNINHYAVHLKLAQHCKSTILQKKFCCSKSLLKENHFIIGFILPTCLPSKWHTKDVI